jgi:hypothetical protein
LTLCAVLINALAIPRRDRDNSFDASHHPVAIVDNSADESLTLSERPLPGQHLAWAIRSPADGHRRHAPQRRPTGASPHPIRKPRCSFSCLGRGPYFHGGEDA